ncbi:MAG: DUF3267 domain-containing protein [Elusimicrobiales bacterium]|nr:DUF3267 domain-containing protein [Elusimicrobiales bacterium]
MYMPVPYVLMKFHIGGIPKTTYFQPDASWRPVLGPGLWSLQLLAVLPALIFAAAVAWLWSYLIPVRDMLSSFDVIMPIVRGVVHLTAGMAPVKMVPGVAGLISLAVVFPLIIIAVAVYALFHELVHLSVHPRVGMSERSILGVWPSKMVPFAYYNGEVSLLRYLTILVMPLIIISFVPILVCGILGRASGLLAVVSIVNVLGSSGDIFMLGLITSQVPWNAKIRGQGGQGGGTFWRL